jgi:hypothetical protein
VKREDLFIVSKLWNTFHEKERVEPIVRKQLEWWGLEYVFFTYPPSKPSLTGGIGTSTFTTSTSLLRLPTSTPRSPTPAAGTTPMAP